MILGGLKDEEEKSADYEIDGKVYKVVCLLDVNEVKMKGIIKKVF